MTPWLLRWKPSGKARASLRFKSRWLAVSMLLTQLNPLAGGGNRSRAVMPTHLTVRGSTGYAPQIA